MSHPFPLPADMSLNDVKDEIENIKVINNFDSIVAQMVSDRLIAKRKYDTDRRNELVDAILPLVTLQVNRVLKEVICSSDPHFYHNVNPRKRPVYVREDKISSLVRIIATGIYGTGVSKIVLRKKVTGCMQAITFVLNQPEFERAL